MDDVIEVSTGSPAGDGCMIARSAESPIIFVRGALPNERVRVKIDEQHSSYFRGQVIDILEANPQRVASTCPAASAGAGCCDYHYARYPYVRELKFQRMCDALARVGKYPYEHICAQLPGLFGNASDITVLDPPDVGWRLRTKLSVRRQGNNILEWGLQRWRSHEVIPSQLCQQFQPELCANVDEYLRSYQHSGRPGSGKETLKLYVIRDDSGENHYALIPESAGRPGAPRKHIGRQTLAHFSIREVDFAIPPQEFWQPHSAAAGTYVALIASWVRAYAINMGQVWDLYCGAGLYARTLAQTYSKTRFSCVDTTALAENFPPEMAIYSGTVARFLTHGTARGGTRNKVDLVIADPPRAGMGIQTVQALLAHQPEWIMHFGCDVASFARDLATYLRSGEYTLREFRIFDAFPGTEHCEIVVLLQRTVID